MNRLPQFSYNSKGDQFVKQRGFKSLASPATASEVVPAKTGYRVAIYHCTLSGSAAATVVFNSASTAVGTPYQVPALGSFEIGSPDNNMPFILGGQGEALTATGVGSATVGINFIYAYVKD